MIIDCAECGGMGAIRGVTDNTLQSKHCATCEGTGVLRGADPGEIAFRAYMTALGRWDMDAWAALYENERAAWRAVARACKVST